MIQARQPGAVADLTWPTVPGGALVLVPVGSLEQHGPHLPLDTDTVIASAVADAVAIELEGDGLDVLRAPPLAYGASGEHQDFPGTTSIGTEALVVIITELVRSLTCWADSVVLVNGHGGNVPALRRAVSGLRGEDRSVEWVPCAVANGDAHAGHVETSIMLHLAPRRVRLQKARVGDCTPVGQLMPRMATEGVRAITSTGVLGDPTGATAAAGELMFAEMAERALHAVRRDLVQTVRGARGG